MKAYVLHGINDFRYEDIPVPLPNENEVIIDVKATGICGSDIPRIYRDGAHTHPLILGHEFSGIVAGIGANVDSRWIGRRVGIFPLIPCGRCLPCSKKQYELCRNYNYLGSRRNGGFAEQVAVSVNNMIDLPDNVTFEEAAMLEPMAVAVHAMRAMDVKKDEIVAICGTGTIGLLLLMFLKEAGAERVLVIGNKDFQREKAMQLGITSREFCDCRYENVDKWLLKQTNGKNVDVFFECVGKNETVKQVVSNTAPMGRIMLVGNPDPDMILSRSVYWKILRNQLTVKGTWNSNFLHDEEDDWHYVMERLTQKRIMPTKLISHAFPFEELEQGFHIMSGKTEEYGKIMGII